MDNNILSYAKGVFRRKWYGDKRAVDEWKGLKETQSKELMDDVAHEVYFELAEQGNAEAMNCLTMDFVKGEGCKKSIEAARYWALKAAEAGSLAAILRLGRFYSLGEICEKNDYEAIKWYRRGVEMGSIECQVELAQMYLDSEIRNVGAAIELFASAAAKGNVEAMYCLGLVFDNLQSGIEIYDEEKALYWYDMAERNGNKYAGRLKYILQSSISEHGYIGVKKNGFFRKDFWNIINERLEKSLEIKKQMLEELQKNGIGDIEF